MFNKFIKIAHKKCAKFEFPESGQQFYDVVVKHASRATTLTTTTTATITDVAADNSDSPEHHPTEEAMPMFLDHPTAIEQLPLLCDVGVSERPALFLRKIQVCCFPCDFSDTLDSVSEIETKRQTLEDILETIISGSLDFDEFQEDLINMVSLNLFRCLPPSSRSIENVDPDEDEKYLDPSWPHLQIVYEILLRYVVSPDTDLRTCRRYIDHVFISNLIDLFDSEDQREREYLKTIIHRIFGKFMVHRPFIRKAINNVFYRFIFETQKHNGIAELLEILGSIINGFALPMKEEHKLFVIRTLIPLHKPKCFSLYHQQLNYCLVQFVEKDNRLADPVIRGILKYWPVTNCPKEALFLGELEEILEATQCPELIRCVESLFRQIGRSLNSSHFQVAERALYLWKNEHIINMVVQNRKVILPVIFESLETNMNSHWNRAIHGLTANVRKMFLEMDAELFEECQRQYLEKEARARELEEKRELTWKNLEAVAAQAMRDDTVLVN